MREMNLAEWERRDAYAYFSRFSNPFFMVTFRQDVTKLYYYTKERGLSFYEGMIWACTEAFSRIPAFRMALRGSRVVELDGRNPSFTDIRPGEEQFRIITMERSHDIEQFCREASRLRREQDSFMDTSKETDDLIYISCLPWIELTAMTNERDLSGPDALNDSIPRIVWGKYTIENGRRILGISLEVNHRFIDGIHIGRFAQELELCMNRLGKPEAGEARGNSV